MQQLLKTTENITISEKYDYKHNSFDILRVILALIVIYGHTYAVLYGVNAVSPEGNAEIFAVFSKGQMGSGSIAVYMFFIISGFLITQSMIRSKSIIKYLLKRMLRIMPALFCSLMLSVFVIGLIITKFSLADYFNNVNNPFKYLFCNLTFGIFGFYYSLADVFSTNPFPNSINASIWTLPNELACYLIVILFYINNYFKKRERVIYVYLISLVLVYYYIRFGYIPISVNDNFWLLSSNYLGGVINVSYFFIAGSLMYCYKDKIKYNKNLFVVFTLCLLITTRMGYLKYSLLLCLPYVTIFVCMLKPCIDLKKIGDFSYGLYIYAFPIQQFLAYYLRDRFTFIPFFIFSTLCILCVSIISWFLVEKPALNLKNKFIKG